ncbi:FkbM family methyltransferase [Candidatus Pelagibacter sp.]|nr:FkbM family methyltransferase [Candidatus Pelagibacter sp.]
MKFLYTNFPKEYGKMLYLKSIVMLLPKIFFLKMGYLNFFGSKNQDRWVVKEIFKFKKKGYFLDLAATNGLMENNTYVLEKFFNWNGIAIEANNTFFKKLKKNRNCLCLNEVVCGDEKNVDFLEAGPTGGIIGEAYDNNFSKRKKLLDNLKDKIIRKKTKTLEKILDENKAPRVIDYFSLDVEGAETEILKNFNFKKYTFLSLTIERPTPELNDTLFKNGYIFVKNFKVDGFYIHKSMIKINNNIKFEKFYQIGKKEW